MIVRLIDYIESKRNKLISHLHRRTKQGIIGGREFFTCQDGFLINNSHICTGYILCHTLIDKRKIIALSPRSGLGLFINGVVNQIVPHTQNMN